MIKRTGKKEREKERENEEKKHGSRRNIDLGTVAPGRPDIRARGKCCKWTSICGQTRAYRYLGKPIIATCATQRETSLAMVYSPDCHTQTMFRVLSGLQNRPRSTITAAKPRAEPGMVEQPTGDGGCCGSFRPGCRGNEVRQTGDPSSHPAPAPMSLPKAPGPGAGLGGGWQTRKTGNVTDLSPGHATRKIGDRA